MDVAGMQNVSGEYVNSYERNTPKAGKSESSKRAVGTEKQNTRDYVRGLEEKYGVHVTLGSNTTPSKFMNYMLGSSGGNNVYIEKNIADRMASDPEYAAKYEALIAKIPEEGKQAEKDIEKLSNGTAKMVAWGMQIHENGKVTYWGVAVNTGPKVRLGTQLREEAQEKLDRQKEAKKEQAKLQERLKDKRVLQAESMEKLMAKIQEKTVDNPGGMGKALSDSPGTGIDFTV